MTNNNEGSIVEVIGIQVLDHVVIGGDEHASLRDLGLM